MPKTHHPATDEMLERFGDALDNRFPELEDEKIKWDIQAVTTDGLHALPKGATAQIKVVGPEERSRGGPDLRILVDFVKYKTYEAISREAMFAHEIYHVDIQKDNQGKTKKDPYGRPRIRLKPDDWYITGFKQVADWYGAKSLEQISHTRMEFALYHQTLFQFIHGIGDQPGLPMGESEDAAHTARKREIEEELAEGGIVRETFAALLSVGHTEAQARKAIDSVARQAFKTVSEMVDAIYRLQMKDDMTTAEVDVNAELVAGVREAEAARDITKTEFNSKNNWRYRPVAEIGLSPETAAILERERVNTVGELVTRRNLGSLATALRGDFACEVVNQIEWFLTIIPENEAAYMREVVAAEDAPKTKASKPTPSPQRDGEDAWRHILVVDLMLAPKSLERLQEHDIETVGELVTLTANGSLDSVLTGQVALDVDDCLERFSNGLPTAQAVDLARAKDPEPRPIEPTRARRKKEKVGA